MKVDKAVCTNDTTLEDLNRAIKYEAVFSTLVENKILAIKRECEQKKNIKHGHSFINGCVLFGKRIFFGDKKSNLIECGDVEEGDFDDDDDDNKQYISNNDVVTVTGKSQRIKGKRKFYENDEDNILLTEQLQHQQQQKQGIHNNYINGDDGDDDDDIDNNDCNIANEEDVLKDSTIIIGTIELNETIRNAINTTHSKNDIDEIVESFKSNNNSSSIIKKVKIKQEPEYGRRRQRGHYQYHHNSQQQQQHLNYNNNVNSADNDNIDISQNSSIFINIDNTTVNKCSTGTISVNKLPLTIDNSNNETAAALVLQQERHRLRVLEAKSISAQCSPIFPRQKLLTISGTGESADGTHISTNNIIDDENAITTALSITTSDSQKHYYSPTSPTHSRRQSTLSDDSVTNNITFTNNNVDSTKNADNNKIILDNKGHTKTINHLIDIKKQPQQLYDTGFINSFNQLTSSNNLPTVIKTTTTSTNLKALKNCDKIKLHRINKTSSNNSSKNNQSKNSSNPASASTSNIISINKDKDSKHLNLDNDNSLATEDETKWIKKKFSKFFLFNYNFLSFYIIGYNIMNEKY